MSKSIKVAVTGAAGNISYAMLFRIASGGVFGPNQPISLSLLEIPPAMGALEGVVMELNDCAFPLLTDINATSDAGEAFDRARQVFMVGSKPRGPGMERSDLIRENGPIFVGQGQALNKAADDVRIMVVGNPCNTNCLIAMKNSDIPSDRFSAMTRLDQNRAQSQLAVKAGVSTSDVTNVTIWGNHSNNQYPDFENALIGGRPAADVIGDETWLKETFVPVVQQRGAAVIKQRGASSAASAASAAIDHAVSFLTPTPTGQWFSASVCSKGQYGVDEGLIFGFPVSVDAQGGYTVIEGVPMSDWGKTCFQKSLDELRQERDVVKDLLK